MHEITVALLAIGVGATFCFYGFTAMRILLPLWGLAVGYWFGASLVSSISGDTFLGTTLSVAIGMICALGFAALSYLYYAAAVIVFTGVVGYWIGSGLLMWIGIDPGLLTFLTGIGLGVVFVMAGITANMPKYLLILLTALNGAGLMIVGLLVLGNVIQLAETQYGAVAAIGSVSWFWQVVWLGLSALGFSVQSTKAAGEELRWAQEWK